MRPRWCVLMATTLLLGGCVAPAIDEPVTLTVLYTNDEHGWIAPTEDHGGAAGMIRRWQLDEGYSEDGPYLVLSGGDTWTGPALSTWFDGEPSVEVMNAMGYHAAALGNHEFDFGVDGLLERMAQAEFAFLAANLISESTGKADLALPYIVQEIGGTPGSGVLRVGIIGLASRATPRTTMPTHVAGLRFDGYAAALAAAAPAVRADGAEVIVVTSHLCSPELRALVPVAKELGIAMLGGGHCHERISRVEDGVALVIAGWQMSAYGRVDIAVDAETGSVSEITVVLKDNPAGGVAVDGDNDIVDLVATWQARLDDELDVTIGHAEKRIGRSSPAMHNLVVDAWLAAYPADVAMSNPGGFRQDIEAGAITLADVVGVLPFDNVLVDVALTGEQIVAAYEHGSRRPAVGGLRRTGGEYTVNGAPLDQDAVYHVLVNDFMYAGGDGYDFSRYDPDAYQTGIDWRQPVIDWITDQRSSADAPLNSLLDPVQR